MKTTHEIIEHIEKETEEAKEMLKVTIMPELTKKLNTKLEIMQNMYFTEHFNIKIDTLENLLNFIKGN
jgi:hypothetical protein